MFSENVIVFIFTLQLPESKYGVTINSAAAAITTTRMATRTSLFFINII
jgi:hypothetical protein